MLAVISDIHGNYPALQAVLDDIVQSGVDELICLGDVANFGPMPAECVARLQSLDCPIIMGNTDDYLLKPREYENLNKPGEQGSKLIDVEHWCAAQLSTENKHFITTFPERLTGHMNSVSTLFFHASPRNYNDIIRVDTPEKDIHDYCDGHYATLMLGGHTHQPFLRHLNESVFINPGSVGAPFQRQRHGSEWKPAWAEYAVISEQSGQPHVAFKRVSYDIAPLMKAASAMPHSDLYRQQWTFPST